VSAGLCWVVFRFGDAGAWGQVVAGSMVWSQARSQLVAHNQFAGRCRRNRRADREILAGVLMILARMVAVVAFANRPAAVTPIAGVRLNAIAAATSHAAFAANFPEGRCAKAEFFKSAMTCSMTA